MFTCELLSVGTEILLGDILNTNAQFLAREMAALGIAVLHQSTVGDNADRLAAEVRASLSRSDIVIATGGLGPTADDITKEVCCQVMGYELVRDDSVLSDISSYFKGKGIAMPETNAKQADVPNGAVIFKNTCGTAPGAALERDGKCVIILPGPPREMKEMFRLSAKPFLEKRYSDGVILSHNIRTIGIGESAMAEKVSELLELSNPTVAPYAKEGEALLRVTAKAADADEAEKLAAPVIKEISERLGGYIYDIDSESIQQTVVRLLREAGMKVAFAESCTAGYIAKRLTEIPGSSEVFECGIVSYSNEIKMKLLGVRAETLESFGAVSEQTALEMAEGVRRVSGADIGISVTGVAGPGNDGDDPDGLSFIGLSAKDKLTAERFMTGHKNEREYNRYVTASRALDILRRYLVNHKE